MVQTRVVVLNGTKSSPANGWILCFQYCRYEYGNGTESNGYRFIWQKPDGKLQPARGQARIPSVSEILALTSNALLEGWGHHNCDSKGFENDED